MRSGVRSRSRAARCQTAGLSQRSGRGAAQKIEAAKVGTRGGGTVQGGGRAELEAG